VDFPAVETFFQPAAVAGARSVTFQRVPGEDILIQTGSDAAAGDTRLYAYWARLGKPDIFDPHNIRHIVLCTGTDEKNHFLAVIVDNASRTIVTYDLLVKRAPQNNYSKRVMEFLQKAWACFTDPAGAARSAATFPSYHYAAAPYELPRQGYNSHCGAIACFVIECVLRCGLPPSRRALEHTEKQLPPTLLGTPPHLLTGFPFWERLRLRMGRAIVEGRLPPDISKFDSA